MIRRKTRIAADIMAVFAILALSSCAFGSTQAHAPFIDRAKQVADGLGRTTGNQLAEFESCWDLNSECGYSVYFTTTDTADDIQTKLNGLGLIDTPHEEIVASRTSSMGPLSLRYSKQLKVTGDNPSNDKHSPGAYSWYAKSKAGEGVLVRLYRLQVWPQTYTFDGRPITGDLIEVTVRYPYRGT